MNNLRSEFLKSACTFESNHFNLSSSLQWLKDQNERVQVSIERIPFCDLKNWGFDSVSGSLSHRTGRFFSIDGIRVRTNLGPIQSWEQPIINQPEIGYLGLIAKRFDGVLHFLMQAKIEPGNVNYVQLSPTIQATRSNYTQAHGGSKPLYLEYFQNVALNNVLLDQLQSEQGARFLMKRNRNIIIHVEEDVPLYDNFIWLTLGHIKELMRFDNVVNMDTRTVISGIHFGDFDEHKLGELNCLIRAEDVQLRKFDLLKSALLSSGSANSTQDVIHFLTDLKSKYDLFIDKVPLHEVQSWMVSKDEISHITSKYFKVIGVSVGISNREVLSWHQPMVQPAQQGICGFICKNINGILHFIVQAKLECGNRDIIELAPTVQCLTGDYRVNNGRHNIPFLDYMLDARRESILFDVLQSEEGGRFFREQNRNLIIFMDENFPNQLPDNYIWMTLNQLIFFNQFNNYLNIQARSLIAAISFS
jgi:oxidase EvaA